MTFPNTRPAIARKRSWRPRYHHLIPDLPWDVRHTLSFPSRQPNKLETRRKFATRSENVNRYFLSMNRDANTLMSHTAAVIITALIFFSLLGAESSVQTTTVFNVPAPSRFYVGGNALRKRLAFSPLEMELHNSFAVPYRYLRQLSRQQQNKLMQLLSSSPSADPLSLRQRKAVFAHVKDCNLQRCLRAIASAIAYSQTTERVAVIFISNPEPESLIGVSKLGSSKILSNLAVLVSITKPIEEFDGDYSKDWAEFSVIEATVHGDLVLRSPEQNDTKLRVSHKSQQPNPVEAAINEKVGEGRTIGNTDVLATLDNLASIDSHVSISLFEVVWSKYSPRTVQEKILSELLQGSSGNSSIALLSASILGRRPETRHTATTDSMLRDKFRIPNILLQGMSPFARKLLLLKLMGKRRKGLKNPRAIFVHAQYGLGNRLRALGSGMAFARRSDRVLVLIWVPDQHLNCKYTDLFVTNDEFVTSDGFEPGEQWPFRKARANDPAAEHVKWYNYMRINGTAPNTAEDEVKDDKDKHIYVSTCYVIQSPVTPFIIRTQSSYWQVLRTLTPHIHVLRLIERFASYPMSSMMGIHIRGKSIKSDIDGVTSAEYSEESSRRTDYWRNLTKVNTFIQEMRRQPHDQLFYVAADQKEMLVRLEREFPSRIFYTARRCDSRDKSCLPFALADILLLARCSSLRGSYWSSFSELSVRIGGPRFLLAGIDFGRP